LKPGTGESEQDPSFGWSASGQDQAGLLGTALERVEGLTGYRALREEGEHPQSGDHHAQSGEAGDQSPSGVDLLQPSQQPRPGADLGSVAAGFGGLDALAGA
jgi:hypothetical protein